MTAVLEATGLGKRYGRRWALSECTLTVPQGRVVGLVGPNGAGKTTLLQLAVGLLSPTAGAVQVLGGRPGDGPAQLGRVGFVAQDTPTYARLSIADHLRFGAWLNQRWDATLAERRIEHLGLTHVSVPGHFPVANVPSSLSLWRSPSDRSCWFSTSRSRASIRWPAAISWKACWRWSTSRV